MSVKTEIYSWKRVRDLYCFDLIDKSYNQEFHYQREFLKDIILILNYNSDISFPLHT